MCLYLSFPKHVRSVTIVQEMQEFHHMLLAPGSKCADVERFLCRAYNPNAFCKMSFFSKASPSPLLSEEALVNFNDFFFLIFFL